MLHTNPVTEWEHNDCYKAIKAVYGDKRAKRSGVLYMKHIDDGIRILDAIGACRDAYQGYCLHPIFQSDEALTEWMECGESYEICLREHINSRQVALALEYRRVANSYLSTGKMEDLVSCPIHSVKEMLIADKVQNYSDFMIHHFTTHPRYAELTKYFQNWLQILGITQSRYCVLRDLLA